MRKTIFIVLGIAAIGALLWLSIKFASFYNQEQKMSVEYQQENKYRSTLYNELVVGIKQITNVAKTNDESYKDVIAMIMEGRKDSEQLGMKWIMEQNPNSNFQEVTKMYQQLARFIESKRANFVSFERKMAEVDAQHEYFLRAFPNNIFAKVFGFKSFGYEPITTTAVKKAVETGVDDDIKLDL